MRTLGSSSIFITHGVGVGVDVMSMWIGLPRLLTRAANLALVHALSTSSMWAASSNHTYERLTDRMFSGRSAENR